MQVTGQVVATVSVALFTSAWVEIPQLFLMMPLPTVALFTSAWVEISTNTPYDTGDNVALFTSAWVEIDSPSGQT